MYKKSPESESNEAWLDRITKRSLVDLQPEEQKSVLKELVEEEHEKFLAGKGNDQYIAWLIKQPKEMLNQSLDELGNRFPSRLVTTRYLWFDPKTTLEPLVQHGLVDYEVKNYKGNKFLDSCIDDMRFSDLKARLYFLLNLAAEPGNEKLAAGLKQRPDDKVAPLVERGKNLNYGQILLNAYEKEKKPDENDAITPAARLMFQSSYGFWANFSNMVKQRVSGHYELSGVPSSSFFSNSVWAYGKIIGIFGFVFGAAALSKLFNYFYPNTEVVETIKK